MQILKQNNQWIAVYKEEGETPLESIRALQKTHTDLENEKLAYAGRLDPMAEGLLLILRGEACKQRDEYLGLDKTYEFEVLFGITSDTQDILGIVEAGDLKVLDNFDQEVFTKHIQRQLRQLLGKHEMPYPAFSSKTVEGKPLFLWALEGKLDEIAIPKRAVEIYDISLDSLSRHTLRELTQQVPNRIAQVTPVQEASKALGADFRRVDVLESWERLQSVYGDAPVFVARITARVSAGTYVRTIARLLGEEIGSGALAWRICRTAMGTQWQLD